MKKYITLLLILSTPAFADSAITVHTGDTVPVQFDKGTLLDAPAAKKIQNQLIDADTCTKENQSYQKSVELYRSNETIYNQENSLLLGRNVELSKALADSRETSDWTKVGYFVLGIAVTGLAVYGASKIVK